MSSTFSACALVPTFDNPTTVGVVVDALRARGLAVVVVDDGSGPDGRAACECLAREERATVRRLDVNQGKGAAVRSGLRVARELGFTHALQVDADGQHDLDCTEVFLSEARAHPDALVLAYPQYGDDAPRSRTMGRKITSFWVAIEVGSRATIRDAMIGFRVYPIDATLAMADRCGARMEFDIEVAVRMVRAGTPTRNLPVPVRYLDAREGGVSHFRPFRDNVSFGRMHSRLCFEGCVGWLRRKAGMRAR